MSDAPTSLRHAETKDDAALAQEARTYVAENPALQLMAELVAKLRNGRFSWWTPESLRGIWNANERMKWFEQRPDIRQRITSGLTGLAPKAARNKQADFQAALVDSVVDDGDVTADQFENAFEPIEIAAYAPVAEIWHKFRERMPWDQDTPAHQELVGWLLDQLLASASTIEGMTRKPILSSHAVRTTIPGKIWHAKIPLEVRVAIDDLRFQRERSKPGEPFHAIHDLSVATPTIIATNIPLRELVRVIEVAEKAMSLPAKGASPTASASKDEPKPEPAAPPPAAAAPAVPPPPDKAPADKAAADKAAADKAAADKAAADKAAADKAAADKAAAEKAAADKAATDKAAADKSSGPKSAIERMAEKVVEKVAGAVPKDINAKSPNTGTFAAVPPQTGKMAVVSPAASPNPLPVPAANAGGEPITSRGPKTDEAPESDRGDDIIVETDDSFKFDDDEEEASGVGTKDDPRGLSKKPEPPPPPKR